MQETIRRILTARVYDVAIETPLDPLPRLSARLGRPVRLKREDLQPVFSFKIRGAWNKIAGLSPEALSRGVICASAGNHAQGVALAATRRGARSTIVMPVTTPAIKVAAVRARGGEVILHGDSFDEAYTEAKAAEAKARDAANQARKYGALAAFLAAATLLIGCAAACAGAALGGRHRDEQTPVRLFGASRFW